MATTLIEKLKAWLIAWLMRDQAPTEIPMCDFQRIRYEIRPCDVLLIEGRSRVSEVIKLATQSAWSHSALYIGRLHDIENPILRQHVEEFMTCDKTEQLLIEGVLGKGTIISPLSKYKRDHIRICRPKGISLQDAQRVIGYAIGRLGVEYNVRHSFDLFRFLYPWSILPRRWRSSLFIQNPNAPTREICSSLLAEAFGSVRFPILPVVKRHQERGIELIQRNPRLFTPRDFDYSPYFEIIKYPIFELSESALYRHLPWGDEGSFSNDDGEVFTVTPPEIEGKVVAKENTSDPLPTDELSEEEIITTETAPKKQKKRHSLLKRKRRTDTDVDTNANEQTETAQKEK